MQSPLPLGEWTFVAGVWDFPAETVTLYRGTEQETFRIQAMDLSKLRENQRQPVLRHPRERGEERFIFIGARDFSGARDARGVAIDDVRIFGGALSRAQVLELRAEGDPPEPDRASDETDGAPSDAEASPDEPGDTPERTEQPDALEPVNSVAGQKPGSVTLELYIDGKRVRGNMGTTFHRGHIAVTALAWGTEPREELVGQEGVHLTFSKFVDGVSPYLWEAWQSAKPVRGNFVFRMSTGETWVDALEIRFEGGRIRSIHAEGAAELEPMAASSGVFFPVTEELKLEVEAITLVNHPGKTEEPKFRFTP